MQIGRLLNIAVMQIKMSPSTCRRYNLTGIKYTFISVQLTFCRWHHIPLLVRLSTDSAAFSGFHDPLPWNKCSWLEIKFGESFKYWVTEGRWQVHVHPPHGYVHLLEVIPQTGHKRAVFALVKRLQMGIQGDGRKRGPDIARMWMSWDHQWSSLSRALPFGEIRVGGHGSEFELCFCQNQHLFTTSLGVGMLCLFLTNLPFTVFLSLFFFFVKYLMFGYRIVVLFTVSCCTSWSCCWGEMRLELWHCHENQINKERCTININDGRQVMGSWPWAINEEQPIIRGKTICCHRMSQLRAPIQQVAVCIFKWWFLILQ